MMVHFSENKNSEDKIPKKEKPVFKNLHLKREIFKMSVFNYLK